jgi:lipoyl(octanoyl) transferase
MTLPDDPSPAIETYFLGRVDFQRCLALQQRLLDEVAGRDDGQIVLLMAEHPPVITVGRSGSPGDVASESPTLRSREIEVLWTNRGGPCLVHAPGQLAIYPMIPLRWHGFQVGEYLGRLQTGIIEALDDLNIHANPAAGRYGVWGRTGQLAALGVAVRHWVTYYGAYLNVCPPMGLFRLVESDPVGHTRMGCLAAERGGVVRMPTVRAVLVQHLAAAFGCQRYHLYTGHPLLRTDGRRTDDR